MNSERMNLTGDIVSKVKYSNSNFLENLLAWEFILFSGGIRFYTVGLNLVIFLATALLLFLNRRPNIKQTSWQLAVFIIFWIVMNQLVLHPYGRTASFDRYVFYAAGAYFAISAVRWDSFKHKLLTALNYILIPSIIIQLAHDYFGLNAVSTKIDERIFDLCFYFFNVGWGEYRMSSVFWEPGQCQLVIVFVLVMFLNEMADYSRWRDNLRKLGIPIIAILLTRSTTGYMCLALIVLVVTIFIRKKTSRKVGLLFPFVAIFAGLISYSIYSSEVVQDKFSDDNVNYAKRSSYNIRLADNLGLIEMATERPLLGYGIGTKGFGQRSLYYNNLTSSNGWLWLAASCGIPLLILYLSFFYKRIKDMRGNIPAILLFAILIIAQSNEYGIFFPVSYFYLYKFRFYGHHIYHHHQLQ